MNETRLSLTAAALFWVANTLGQGQFMFANKNLLAAPPIDARLVNQFGTPLEGAAYLAQAYVKLTFEPDSSFAPVGSAVTFRSGVNAGYIVPVVVTTPFAGGTDVAVQMRAWESAGGSTYESAVVSGHFYGFSDPVTLLVAVAPNTPPDMIGLQPFSLIPEPSTTALAVPALLAVGWRQRRRTPPHAASGLKSCID